MGGGDHTRVQNRFSRRRHNFSIHWRQWSPLLPGAVDTQSTCSPSKSDRQRRLRRDSVGIAVSRPAVRHWIIHWIPAGTATAVRAGWLLFRCNCLFKKRPQCFCGSRSDKNRVRVLPLQEVAVTAAPAAASSRQSAALGHSHSLYNRIKVFGILRPKYLFIFSAHRGCRQQEVEAAEAVAVSG